MWRILIVTINELGPHIMVGLNHVWCKSKFLLQVYRYIKLDPVRE